MSDTTKWMRFLPDSSFMMLGHEFERLEFYMTNTSLSDVYNDVGNEVPETFVREQGFKAAGLGSSRDKWWNWMKCDKPLDGKANSNMKVLSPDAIDHICSRLWEATGEQTESRYPL